jgi:hypothetical protein
MTTAHQLPEDIGQREVVANGQTVVSASEFPTGPTTADKSIPVVHADDSAIKLIDTYESLSSVRTDLLGFPRITRTFDFLSKTDDYALSETDWITDVQGVNEIAELDGTQSAKWTNTIRVSVAYLSPANAEVKFTPEESGSFLSINGNKGGYQEARVSSRRRYRYQPGRIVRSSMAIRLSMDNTPTNVTHLWGMGDSSDGFFVEVIGDGQGDRLRILYRNSSGNGYSNEIRYPRSSWSGDQLDGSGLSKQNLDFSKSFMTLIEWGWYGASDVKIYFYMVDENDQLPSSIKTSPRARWILAHELVLADTLVKPGLTEDDGAGENQPYDVPSLRRPSLPLFFSISNSGSCARPQFLQRYGASIVVDGGTDERARISYVDGGSQRKVKPLVGGLYSGYSLPMLTLESRKLLKTSSDENVENTLVTKPLRLTASSTDLVELELWLDPETTIPIGLGHFNGSLPYRSGDYLNPFNTIPTGFTVPDEDQSSVFLGIGPSQTLGIDRPYTNGDPISINMSVKDTRVITGGRLLATFLIDERGADIDLSSIFSSQRALLSSEYDNPPSIPSKTTAVLLKSFDSSTGVCEVEKAFPLRLYVGQRVLKGNVVYYVHSLISSFEFKLKASKIATTPVLTGLSAGDVITADYSPDLEGVKESALQNIYASQLVIAAKPFKYSPTSLDSSVEYDAEWIRLNGVDSDNEYSQFNAPSLKLYVTHGIT